MQKLLYVPLIDKVGANEQWDLLNAFRSRFHTVAFDYLASEDVHRDMLSLLTAFNPDIVHMQLQDTRVFDPSKLANMKKSCRGSIWTQWCGDVRDEPIQHVIDIGKVIDLTLVSARGMVSSYQEKIDKSVMHWDHAVGARFFSQPIECDGSVVLCAHNYDHFPGSEDRRRLAGALKTSFPDRFKLWGNGWEDATALPDEAVAQVQWVIDHPAESAATGKAGRDRVRKEHTWDKRVDQYEVYLASVK